MDVFDHHADDRHDELGDERLDDRPERCPHDERTRYLKQIPFQDEISEFLAYVFLPSTDSAAHDRWRTRRSEIGDTRGLERLIGPCRVRFPYHTK